MASAVMSPPAEAGTPPDIKLERERKPALTPPTSEGTNKKDDDSSSELSDLEPEGDSFSAEVKQEEVDDNVVEEDDDGEIFPDHYYDDGNVPVFKPVSGVWIDVVPIKWHMIWCANTMACRPWHNSAASRSLF